MSVLAVTNIKGGVGKTTTAVNLAFLSARAGTPTLLWDLDPQGSASYTLRVRAEVSVGCARLLRDEDALADAIKGTDFPGLDLLPADFSYRKLDALLARSDRRGRGLQRAVDPLREAYSCILLDCPPGISFLAENVFGAADALLVPTLPTVFALRTVARLARHVAQRRDRCPLLLAFLDMADRRRALHRAVEDGMLERSRARSGNGAPAFPAWLATSIPQASVVEQMGVQRAPLAAFAPASAAARAFARLWAEILAALGRAGSEAERRAACLQLADDIESTLREIERDLDAATPPGAGGELPAAPSPEADAAAGPDRQLRLALPDDEAVAMLLRVAGVAAPPPGGSERLVHVFDTDGAALRAADCGLQLHEAGGRYSLVLDLPATEAGGGWQADVVGLDAGWALKLLSGRQSPLDVLRTRLGPGSALRLARVAALAGERPLVRTVSYRALCRSVEAIQWEQQTLRCSIERTEWPDGRVEHALLVTAGADEVAACASALQGLAERAGVAPRPAPARAACCGAAPAAAGE